MLNKQVHGYVKTPKNRQASVRADSDDVHAADPPNPNGNSQNDVQNKDQDDVQNKDQDETKTREEPMSEPPSGNHSMSTECPSSEPATKRKRNKKTTTTKGESGIVGVKKAKRQSNPTFDVHEIAKDMDIGAGGASAWD